MLSKNEVVEYHSNKTIQKQNGSEATIWPVAVQYKSMSLETADTDVVL